MLQVAPARPSSQNETSPQDALPWLDAARVIAAYAVVWIHTPQSPALQPSVAIGRFAVPFFLAASVLLVWRGLRRRPDRPWTPYVLRRSRRLLLPFAAWSLIYLVLKLVKRQVAPDLPSALPGWEAVVLGTAYHLWFLPYLFTVSVVTFGVGRLALRIRRPQTVATAAVGLGAALAWLPSPACPPAYDSCEFMWLATPGVCWAFSPAIVIEHQPQGVRRAGAWLPTAAVFLISTTWLWLVGRHAVAEALAGLSVLVLVCQLPSHPAAGIIGKLAPLAYGVYLTHLFVLKLAETSVTRWKWEASPTRDLTLLCLTIVISTALAWSLSRSPKTRWLLG